MNTIAHIPHTLLNNQKNIQKATPAEFAKKDGPFMCALEEALQSFSV